MKITPLENWITQKSQIGCASRKLLEDYQLERIVETISFAKIHSRFYAERLKSFNPQDLNTLGDLTQLPFTYPPDIQKDPFSFLCVPQSEVKRIVTLLSTGTSGSGKRIFFTEEDLNKTVDFFVYGMSCLVDKTDRVLVLLPGEAFGSIGDLLKKALETIGIECFVSGVITDYDKTANEIIDKNISCLVGIPSQILYLSRTYAEVFKSKIKSVLLSTDYVPEILIRELTEQCGCRVFTHYGMTEMGYGGGVECEALNGYHMREADLFFEIVDPISGKILPEGQWGEVVFTTLSRQAMPLIRYRTGDIAAFSLEPCSCGTFLKTLKRVRGRLDNRIELCGGRFLYLSELDEEVLSFREVKDYRASFQRDNCLNIEVVTANSQIFEHVKCRLTERLLEYLYKNFGSDAELRIQVTQKCEPDKLTSSMIKKTFK